MDAVCGECGETDRIEPEEKFIVDRFCLLREILIVLVFPIDEDECDVCSDCRDDHEKRIFEGRRRRGSGDEVPDAASARGCQERKDIDSEDVHLFADTRDGTGHCKSDSAYDVGDQDEEFGIHSRHYICFRAKK